MKIHLCFIMTCLLYLVGCELLDLDISDNRCYEIEGSCVPKSNYKASLYMIDESYRVFGPTNYVLVIRAKSGEEWNICHKVNGKRLRSSLVYYCDNGKCMAVKTKDVDITGYDSAFEVCDRLLDVNYMEEFNSELCAVVVECGGWANIFAVPRAEKIHAPCLERGKLVAESNYWCDLLEMSQVAHARRFRCGGVEMGGMITQHISASDCCLHIMPDLPRNVNSLVLKGCFDKFSQIDYPNVSAIVWNIFLSEDCRVMNDLQLTDKEQIQKELELLRHFSNLKCLTLVFGGNKHTVVVDLSTLNYLKHLRNVEIFKVNNLDEIDNKTVLSPIGNTVKIEK